MPATPLYTITVQDSGRATFELDPGIFTQALNEANAERQQQIGLYKFYLAADLIKENPARDSEHAIYLGEDICTVYEPGEHPKVVPFPSLSIFTKNTPLKLEDPNFKEYVLAQVIGSRTLTIQHHTRAYCAANPRQEVLMHYSDTPSYRDINFRTVIFDLKDTSPILYRYSATEQGDQITLRIDVPEDTLNARLGLENLKRYATKLLTMVKDPKDSSQWPKIEILGEGAKTIHDENGYTRRRADSEYPALAIPTLILGIIMLAAAIIFASVTPWAILFGFVGMISTLFAVGAFVSTLIGSKSSMIPGDMTGHDFCLIYELPGRDLEKAVAGKLYLDRDGTYIVRNTASSLNHGKVEQGKIDQQELDILLKGNSLKKQLKNIEFKKAILKITAGKGHTCENVHERDLADYYAIHFAMRAVSAAQNS